MTVVIQISVPVLGVKVPRCAFEYVPVVIYNGLAVVVRIAFIAGRAEV